MLYPSEDKNRTDHEHKRNKNGNFADDNTEITKNEKNKKIESPYSAG